MIGATPALTWKPSVPPHVGGFAQRSLLGMLCEVTSIVLATVVVMLGVAGVVVAAAVGAPFCTSMGVVVSTPLKV
jgi:hypothetical protein